MEVFHDILNGLVQRQDCTYQIFATLLDTGKVWPGVHLESSF